MRVLVLFEYSTVNGGENSFLSTLGALRAANCEVVASAPPGGPLRDALLANHVSCELLAGPDPTQTQDSRRSELAQVIQHVRPDLVHANSLSMARLAGPVIRDRQLKSLGHLRDIVRLSRQAVRDVNEHTRLLAVSRATKDWHVAAGLDAAKTHVLYNGVDLDRFSPGGRDFGLHDELGIPHDSLVIGGVGQLGMRKGWDLLLAALHRLAAEFPTVHLVLVGERHSNKDEAVAFVDELQAAANRSELRGRVHFLGRREDVANLLTNLDLLVHPARQEPLGRVLLEAAACGLPIVATRVGGTVEIFPPSSAAAVLIGPNSVASLAASMRDLLQSAAKRAALGFAARRRTAASFDAAKTGRELLRHYREIIS